MKNFLFVLLGTVILTGAGCNLAANTEEKLEEDAQNCTYEGTVLKPGESYDDGCNTHTCQGGDKIVSTERACEAPPADEGTGT